EVSFNLAIFRYVVDHKRYGPQLPNSVCGTHCEDDGQRIDDESMPVNDKVDGGEKFIHEPEVQVLKMTLCRRWQPGKNTGYQHETHKEQGHDVDACDDTELAKNRNVSGQERQESDGYR